jgi:hypothetical protein
MLAMHIVLLRPNMEKKETFKNFISEILLIIS